MESIRRMRRGRRRWLTSSVALTSLIVAISVLTGNPTPTTANHSERGFDVDPDTETVNAGLPVVLTALIDAADHDTDARADGRTVLFFFRPGSPNDTPASPDLECTVVQGACSVSYVPAVNGTDLICATTHGDDRHCGEPWDAADGRNREDVVQRIVVNGAAVWQLWSAIVEGVDHAVRPEAAAKVATTFGFPLVLMLAVVIFLVIQYLVDRRDPKLRTAPRTVFETMQKFRDEDEL